MAELPHFTEHAQIYTLSSRAKQVGVASFYAGPSIYVTSELFMSSELRTEKMCATNCDLVRSGLTSVSLLLHIERIECTI